jgi:hypothetical protein
MPSFGGGGGQRVLSGRVKNILGMAQNFIAGPLRHPGRCRRVATSCLLRCRGREYRGGP